MARKSARDILEERKKREAQKATSNTSKATQVKSETKTKVTKPDVKTLPKVKSTAIKPNDTETEATAKVSKAVPSLNKSNYNAAKNRNSVNEEFKKIDNLYTDTRTTRSGQTISRRKGALSADETKQRNQIVSNIGQKYGLTDDEVNNLYKNYSKQETIERKTKNATKNALGKVAGTVGAVGDNILAGLTAIPNLIKDLANDDKGENVKDTDATHYFRNSADATRSAIRDTIKSEGGKTAYNVGNTALDIGANIGLAGLTGGSNIVAPTLNALGEVERAMVTNLRNGADTDKAAGAALARGVTQFALDKIGLKDADIATKGDLAKQVLKTAGVEGGLNALQEGLGIATDRAILGRDSEYSKVYNDVLDSMRYSGTPMEEIKKIADKTARNYVAGNVAQGFGTGALFGGAMAGLNGVPSLRKAQAQQAEGNYREWLENSIAENTDDAISIPKTNNAYADMDYKGIVNSGIADQAKSIAKQIKDIDRNVGNAGDINDIQAYVNTRESLNNELEGLGYHLDDKGRLWNTAEVEANKQRLDQERFTRNIEKEIRNNTDTTTKIPKISKKAAPTYEQIVKDVNWLPSRYDVAMDSVNEMRNLMNNASAEDLMSGRLQPQIDALNENIAKMGYSLDDNMNLVDVPDTRVDGLVDKYKTAKSDRSRENVRKQLEDIGYTLIDDEVGIRAERLDDVVTNYRPGKEITPENVNPDDRMGMITRSPEELAGNDLDPAHDLAWRYAEAYSDLDHYDYMDMGEGEIEGLVEQMADDIAKGNDLTSYIDMLEDSIDDAPDVATEQRMTGLVEELRAIQEGGITQQNVNSPINDTEITRPNVNNPVEEVDSYRGLNPIPYGNEVTTQSVNYVPKANPTPEITKRDVNRTVAETVNDNVLTAMPESDGGNADIGKTPANGDEKVRSFSKRGSLDENLPDIVREELAEDTYKVIRNADVTERANSLYDANNLTQTRSNFDSAVKNNDPVAALLGYNLAREYSNQGNYDAARDVMMSVSKALTRGGQFTQAAKLAMMQNDPMAALRNYMKDLEELNKWGQKRYKKKWNDLVLDDTDVQKFNDIKVGDSDSLNNLVDELNTKYGKEIPSNWWDKFVGASKTAMLLNPRTQGRNIFANLASLPLRSTADRVSALGQNAIHLIDKDFKVTQSLVGGTAKQKKAASQVFENLKTSILGENKMKDNVGDIKSHRQTFNDDFLAKWIDNATNGGIQKLNQKFGADANQSTMETLSNLTYWLMGDVGDTPFVKKNFVNRLASYMKAQGIENIEDIPDDAIAIATQEALKATFKDDNAFSKALQNTKKDWGKFGEVVFPFTKTPANLFMRAVDFSPAGLINTFRKAKSGAELSTVIDELSKNVTGTALIYLGYKLRESGLMTGNYSDDPNEKDFQKRQGMLENAFNINGDYWTYDWAQPLSTPLIIGSVVYDAIQNSDKENTDAVNMINSVFKGGAQVANSILELSPLQSLSDILGGSNYTELGTMGRIANEVMETPQRLIPSLLGATARTIDPVMRDTYTNDPSLTGLLSNQLYSSMAKIPGLSKTLPASYDTWGNEIRRSDTIGEAAVAQYVNPGQLGNDNSIPLDADIKRLYENSNNDDRVFPHKADRSLKINNETVYLTPQQHSDYQRDLGQLSQQLADGIINGEKFNHLTDGDKVEVLDKAYGLANQFVKEDLFNHSVDSNKQAKEAYRKGGVNGLLDYLSAKSMLDQAGVSASEKNIEGVKDGGQEFVDLKTTAKDLKDNYNISGKNAEYALQNGVTSDELIKLNEMGADYKQYANIHKTIPRVVTTPQDFQNMYDDINSYNTDTKTVGQKDLLNYLNATDPEYYKAILDTFQKDWKKKIYREENGEYVLR